MRNTCLYKVAGPKTFRLASTQVFKKWGSNLQNIEKSVRVIYEPDGYNESLYNKCLYYLKTFDLSIFTQEELDTLKVFVQVDQSGAEALIVAYYCEAGQYRELFKNGIKPHSFLGMHLFKDVWPKKMRELNLISGDSDFNIDDLLRTPINQLKLNPYWKPLDATIKDSDNWSMSERCYYLAKQTEHSCVDEKTAVLTRTGWKYVTSVSQTEEIAIWDNGIIKFEVPSRWYVGEHNGTMYHFSGDEIDQFVTPEHRMIYTSNEKLHVRYASDAFKLNRPNIPTSGEYVGGSVNLEDWRIKLLVAIQADGHWPKSKAAGSINRLPKVVFNLVKQRKIDRLLNIVKESGYRYSTSNYADGSTNVVVYDLQDTLRWFNSKKKWNSWLLQLSASNLRLLIDELKYWDGTYSESYQHKREAYFSAIRDNVSWIKTICHLIGKQGTVNKGRDVWSVGINNRKFSIASKNEKIVGWKGKVYCPTVSSGFFICLRDSKISTSSNSNYDIQPPKFRLNILDKSGGKIVISKEDSERFLATKFSLFPEIKGYHKYVESCARRDRILYNMMGHPYQITSYEILETQLKELYAWCPQSTVGEITNTAFARMFTFAKDNRKQYDLLANTHDSYLLQCPVGQESECARKAKEFMEQEFTSPIDGAVFNMRSEAQVGFNWSSWKKEKNELGLREIKL